MWGGGINIPFDALTEVLGVVHNFLDENPGVLFLDGMIRCERLWLQTSVCCAAESSVTKNVMSAEKISAQTKTYFSP